MTFWNHHRRIEHVDAFIRTIFECIQICAQRIITRIQLLFNRFIINIFKQNTQKNGIIFQSTILSNHFASHHYYQTHFSQIQATNTTNVNIYIYSNMEIFNQIYVIVFENNNNMALWANLRWDLTMDSVEILANFRSFRIVCCTFRLTLNWFYSFKLT